ncbi:hypothetical protein [Sphingobacterium hungaricum]|uniref:Uncharacterized protein n=1 Tax=Sphingobacterium hungaricum TaxID=2082723 RepID=A0A928YQD3_9SPHI|nr:hypothetical protein [Sphingobacterium hungaricum]MBE8712920.1 hypothetical protein [Sphingobacterium hungaricum]
MSEDIIAEFQVLVIIIFVVQMTLWLLFANTIRKTLNLIAEENRCILPNQAWFVAIPLFNIYWNFQVARRLSDSLTNEFFDRKIEAEENPTHRDGFLYSITNLLCYIPFPPFWIIFLRTISFINFVTYWFRINQCRILLIEHNKWKEETKNNED